MSGWLWGYSPSKCDGDYCPYNCDKCEKAEIPSLTGVVKDIFEEDWFHGSEEQQKKILHVCEDSRFSLDDVTMATWLCSSAEYADIDARLNEEEFL